MIAIAGEAYAEETLVACLHCGETYTIDKLRKLEDEDGVFEDGFFYMCGTEGCDGLWTRDVRVASEQDDLGGQTWGELVEGANAIAETRFTVRTLCEVCGGVRRQWLGRLPVGDEMRSFVGRCELHPDAAAVVEVRAKSGRILVDVGGGARVELGQ